jgi:hypothetical protein
VYRPEQFRPMPGWAVCRSLEATSERASGLIMARGSAGMESGKTTECVAEILRFTQAHPDESPLPEGTLEKGSRIIIRDFLKFANPIGDLVGADRDDRYFLFNLRDALAVIQGPVVVGFYDEFVLE